MSFALAERVGRAEAHRLVRDACARAVAATRPLREELLDDGAIRAHLSPAEIDAALDPAGYLGSADVFVARALDLYRNEREADSR